MKKVKNLLSIYDFTVDDIYLILDRTVFLKHNRISNGTLSPLSGKKIGMIFEKSSTRTRVSFEVGIMELGGYPIFMSPRDLQLGRGEPVKDTARVLERYIDGVIIRTFEQERIEEFTRYFGKPVINGLTDLYHPAQILTDIFTAFELKSGVKSYTEGMKGNMEEIIRSLKIVYFGDANNMANSWVSLQAMLGFELILAMPEGFNIEDRVAEESACHGGKFTINHDKINASENADIVTTDVFVSMGQEENQKNREKIEKLKNFIIDDSVISAASADVLFLHCLPVHRNEEVTEKVFERFSGDVFTEAENRLHVQKAVMEMLFC